MYIILDFLRPNLLSYIPHSITYFYRKCKMDFVVPLGGWGTDFHNISDEQKSLLMNYFLLWGYFDANILKGDCSLESIRSLVSLCPFLDFEFDNNGWIQSKFNLYKKRFQAKRAKHPSLYFAINHAAPNIRTFFYETYTCENPNAVDQVIALTLIVSRLREYLTKQPDRLELLIVMGVNLEDAIEVLKRLYNLLDPNEMLADD
jgi:hypothetical protein